MNRSVFFVNGFIESGKTNLITYTITHDDFFRKGDTLLILCEEGIDEYDNNVLARLFTNLVTVDKEEDFTKKNLDALASAYDPDRIIIEYNGMWNSVYELPDDWEICQQITTVNAQTFNTYFKNMRTKFVTHLKNSDIILVNRAIDHEQIPNIKRSLRAVNNNAGIVFEDQNGRVDITIEEELPYDLNADYISVNDEDFGLFYLDALENQKRYENKKVIISGMVAKIKNLPENQLLIGRLAMTCCVEDMNFFGLLCENFPNAKSREWYQIFAVIHYEFSKYFNAVGPVLIVENVKKISEIKNIISI